MSRHPADEETDVSVTRREARPQPPLNGGGFGHSADSGDASSNDEQQNDVKPDRYTTAPGRLGISTDCTHFKTPARHIKHEPEDSDCRQCEEKSNVKAAAPDVRQHSGLRIWSALREIRTSWIVPDTKNQVLQQESCNRIQEQS